MIRLKVVGWFWPLLAFSSLLVRTYESVNLPISISPAYIHDDGLFMRLASELVAGKWLGTFNQYTLMKGPGYPIFLAAASETGLPVTLVHGALQTLGIALAAYVVARLSRRAAFGWCSFVFLMLLPQPFSAEFQRVVRDQIYWPQCLIVLAALGLGILSSNKHRWTTIFWGLVGGSVLSWAWLTREEGLWLLPGLLMLLSLGSWRAYRLDRSLVRPFVVGLAATIGFSVPLLSFMAINKIYYGKFVSVDFNERNFQAAFGALQRVDDGHPTDFVPMNADARRLAAHVSPTFAPLENSLRKGGPLEWWTSFGCSFYPQSCGDYGGGWFLWAFRDAAALNGYYTSPAVSEELFASIAEEIETACNAGTIPCKSGLFNLLPPMSLTQLESMPEKLIQGLSLITTAHASLEFPAPLIPSVKQFSQYWAFLNFPNAVFPAAAELQGWFYAGDKVWPTFYVKSADGSRAMIRVTRSKSPDLEAYFGSSGASFNRFSAVLPCGVDCSLVAELPGVAPIEVQIKKNANASINGKTGLWIEAVNNLHDGDVLAQLNASRMQHSKTSMSILEALFDAFYIVFPLIGALGFLAFAYAIRIGTPSAEVSALLALAFVSYVLAATRVVLLAIVDASSFPALILQYALPGLVSLAYGSILSISAAILVLGGLRVQSRPDERLPDDSI